MLDGSSTALHSSAGRQLKAVAAKYLDLFIAVMVLARFAWIFSMPLRSQGGLLQFAEDDFYYYLKTAQNFAWHHQITAFEGVWTNGFHPLYFLLLTGISVFVRSLPGVYRFLWLLDTASDAAVFLLTRRIFARLTGPVMANALALAIAYLCIPIICCQMEVTLALPLGFAFLLASFVEPLEIRPQRAAVMGLLASLTFLARLDAAFVVVLYLTGFLALKEYRRALTRASGASFLAASLPLPLLYLWLNHHIFGLLLPVSGMAKELRRTRVPSFGLLHFFSKTDSRLLFAAMIGILLTAILWQKLSGKEKLFLLAVLLDPFIFYGLETFTSDWPIWPWYFYALRFSAAGVAVCCIIFHRILSEARYLRLPVLLQRQPTSALLLLAVGMKLARMGYTINPWMVEIQHAAGILDYFAETHRGVYAMGDRAGMFLISTTNPVLQVEGLTMDKAYLEHMRAEDDLRSVLSGYGVNYYVSFVPKRSWDAQFRSGCFHAAEPFVAGPSSMHMRSMFCGTPIYRFAGFDGVYVIYPILPT